MSARSDAIVFKWALVAVIGVAIASGSVDIARNLKDAQVTRAAMENGYVQEVVDGQVVWRKQGATVSEWLKWIVEEVKELF